MRGCIGARENCCLRAALERFLRNWSSCRDWSGELKNFNFLSRSHSTAPQHSRSPIRIACVVWFISMPNEEQRNGMEKIFSQFLISMCLCWAENALFFSTSMCVWRKSCLCRGFSHTGRRMGRISWFINRIRKCTGCTVLHIYRLNFNAFNVANWACFCFYRWHSYNFPEGCDDALRWMDVFRRATKKRDACSWYKQKPH